MKVCALEEVCLGNARCLTPVRWVSAKYIGLPEDEDLNREACREQIMLYHMTILRGKFALLHARGRA